MRELFRGIGHWFLVLGSWFLVLGCWLLVLGSWILGGRKGMVKKEDRIKHPKNPARINENSPGRKSREKGNGQIQLSHEVTFERSPGRQSWEKEAAKSNISAIGTKGIILAIDICRYCEMILKLRNDTEIDVSFLRNSIRKIRSPFPRTSVQGYSR